MTKNNGPGCCGCGGGGGGGGTGGTSTVGLCYCPAVPVTLAMTSGSSTCNYGMFQTCTLQYGPVPAAYANLGLGQDAFISVESFPDELAGGALFQYFLGCLQNQYTITRIYATSPYGSPYIDGILYTWFVGAYGNTCSPFMLDNGTGFSFTGEPCSVTIDQTS